jgi:hypothetical protein
MFQLGNLSLTLSHTFETGGTLAFLHGWNIFSNRHAVTKEEIIPHRTRIQSLIHSTISTCYHPLLMPIILLKEHIFRGDEFRRKLSSRVTEIEQKFNVTKSARLAMKAGLSMNLRQLMSHEGNRTELTTLLNSTMTDTINFASVLKWDRRYCQFLQSVYNQLQSNCSQRFSGGGKELEGILRLLECDLTSTSDFTESMSSRLNLQLSVV